MNKSTAFETSTQLTQSSPLLPLPEWEYAMGKPLSSAIYKTRPEDFIVIENLGFELTGSGEHLFLLITKIGCNTIDVTQALAHYFKVSLKDVGYSGLKDKHAVAKQWFSIYLPRWKGGVDRTLLESSLKKFAAIESLKGTVSIERVVWHSKKLKRGAHKTNQFIITLTDVAGDLDDFNTRCDTIEKNGAPNYFGPQRFGHNGMNIVRAQNLFEGTLRTKNKKLRGMYLSAARSLLFNAVVSKRVALKSWNQMVDGDLYTFESSNALFLPEEYDAVIQDRLKDGEIHPTGPLFGKGDTKAPLRDVLEIESEILKEHSAFCEGIVQQGVEADRRALRVLAQHFTVSWIDSKTVTLSFELVRGAFATSLLREICLVSEPER